MAAWRIGGSMALAASSASAISNQWRKQWRKVMANGIQWRNEMASMKARLS
jgi:hypothetical protein